MPLVRIDVYESTPPLQREAIASAVYEAMREAIGIPEGDRFVVVNAHGSQEMFIDSQFMGMKRSERFVLVQVFLGRGRTVELKQSLFAAICEKVQRAIGISSDDVMTVLTENTLSDWSFGKGVAQFVLTPPAWVNTPVAGD